MSCIRSVRVADGKFVMLSHEAGQDKRLSWAARGLVYFILSLPPDHHLTAAWLVTQAPNGRESTRSALAELEACGYFTRERRQNAKGYWEWDQVLSDTAFPQVAPCDGNPSDGCPSDKNLIRKAGPVPVKPKSRSRTKAQVKSAPRGGSGRYQPGAPLPAVSGPGLKRARTDRGGA